MHTKVVHEFRNFLSIKRSVVVSVKDIVHSSPCIDFELRNISQNINLVAPAMSEKAKEMNLTAPLKNVESSKDVEMS